MDAFIDMLGCSILTLASCRNTRASKSASCSCFKGKDENLTAVLNKRLRYLLLVYCDLHGCVSECSVKIQYLILVLFFPHLIYTWEYPRWWTRVHLFELSRKRQAFDTCTCASGDVAHTMFCIVC